MKILLLANHFNTGGITTYLLTLVRGFIKRGHTVLVATSGGDMVQSLESLGARHIRFSYNIKSEIHPKLFWQVPRLAALVRNEKVDVLHAQTRVAQMSAALVSRWTGVPYVSTCHGFFKPRLGRRLLPLWGQKVIAVSSQVRVHLLHDFHQPPERVVCIPNGIDLDKFTPLDDIATSDLRRSWGVSDARTVGIIARLSDVKGHKFLVAAMPIVLKKVPSAKCLIFGDGPMKLALQAQVKESNLQSQVLFYSVVNRTADVLPLLDVFVLPSIQEGLGLALLESAAMGLPAVASRVGGLPAVVKDQETGLLVPSQDPEALAQSIITLLNDIPRAREMGQKAMAFVTHNFSADPMVGSTLAVYQDVIGSRQ